MAECQIMKAYLYSLNFFPKKTKLQTIALLLPVQLNTNGVSMYPRLVWTPFITFEPWYIESLVLKPTTWQFSTTCEGDILVTYYLNSTWAGE